MVCSKELNRFYVYSYLSEKDGLFWIGKGINDRIEHPHNSSPYCYNILEARKKDGVKVQKKKIFDGLDEDDALAWEVNLIWFYEPKCNLTVGGEGTSGYRHTEKTRERLSEEKRGNKHPMWGKHPTEETRKKLSKALIGKNNPMFGKRGKESPNYGKHRSQETKVKLSKAQQGKTHSEETKKKLSQLRVGEGNTQAKLTWKLVKEIREKHLTRMYTLLKLAKEYTVSEGAIQGVVYNRNWCDADYEFLPRRRKK